MKQFSINVKPNININLKAPAWIKKFGASLGTGEWSGGFLGWLLLYAGHIADCVFLVASLWMCINANVHPLVLQLISEQMSVNITELATSAYVGLPELILALAIITTIARGRVWFYNKRDMWALTWFVLFGLPTLLFAGLTVITIGNSVASATFEAPTWLVVTRAIAAFVYAITSLVYGRNGVKQEADRLKEKDALIEDLKAENLKNLEDTWEIHRTEIKELREQISRLNQKLEDQNTLLSSTKKQLSLTENALNKSRGNPLEAYSQDVCEWLKSGVKSVSVDDITRFTGHKKVRITNAIKSGKLQTTPRNKELILVDSLIQWLAENPVSIVDSRDTPPYLQAVNG